MFPVLVERMWMRRTLWPSTGWRWLAGAQMMTSLSRPSTISHSKSGTLTLASWFMYSRSQISACQFGYIWLKCCVWWHCATTFDLCSCLVWWFGIAKVTIIWALQSGTSAEGTNCRVWVPQARAIGVRLGGLGEHCQLLRRGPGWSPGHQRFFCTYR